ncbi:glycosyl hydrolase family protein [Streptomyces polygonati]|uniref:Glycosyl hydrolase family protein n=1 Tax=Streptomyces polygonati TaxID=1617087 RepID=A0ABV8HF66_9ACTN
MRDRFRLWAALLTALAALTAATATATAATATEAPAAAAASVVTIGSTTTGTSLTAGSAGLSFEASDLALSGFTSGNLAAYLRTLGTSTLRIGGNTVDQTFWTSTGETPPSWSIATITPSGLTALGTLARAAGWKVILGVNLKQYNPARAADEASHAASALGSSLQAIEIGNEPDLYPQYSGNTAKFLTDFSAYVAAITKAVPGVAIVGTDAAGAPGGSFQNAFIANQAALARPSVSELTSHYYPLTSSTCGGSPTIADLLGTGVRNAETAVAQSAAAQAARLGLPAVMDEGNSVVCEGQEGVSDVFAAALWEIDEQLDLARGGVAGDYMHGTVIQCDAPKPLFMYYTPLCAPTAADAAAGRLAAQPEYYGLAAVHQVGAGDFLTLDNPAWAAVRAYAVKHSDGTMTVVLDNVQDPRSNGPTTLQLDLGAAYTSGRRTDLTAAGLTATTGITLGGQSVQSDGSLAAPTTTAIGVSGATTTVTVPAGSASILTFGNGQPPAATTFVGSLSGKCLSVSGGSTANGATADIYTCDGSGSESWTPSADGTVIGGLSGKCLEVVGGSTANYAGVDISACDGGADQQWAVTAGGSVVAAQSGKCLSVTGASTANGALADIYTCNGSGSEIWTQR